MSSVIWNRLSNIFDWGSPELVVLSELVYETVLTSKGPIERFIKVRCPQHS